MFKGKESSPSERKKVFVRVFSWENYSQTGLDGNFWKKSKK